MNVSCPDCRSIFRVDPAKVPPTGVRARCSVCSGVIVIPAPTGQTTPTGGTVRATTSVGQSGLTANPASASQTTASWESQSQRPSAPPAAARQARPPAAPATPAEAPAPMRPRPESIERVTPPSPASGLPEFAPPPPPPPAPARPAPPFTPPPSAASFNPTPAAPPSGQSTRPYVPPASSSRVAPPSRPLATPGASAPVGDSGARRPLNPFLSKDPNQRAKRLARALVSDIITYHPAKHAEGLRDGTLKQLFREEIKKSFEEYIAQVGQQLAESTTYFQEALNEVLGAGKKIF